ncbi:siroheme synthase CysG [Coralliovum pocilloporae]|uniref:siroheme synthase CysG n=1 Tax=Coralliovum pocilloporae TaxID=3066369 RepID=UPI0033075E0D
MAHNGSHSGKLDVFPAFHKVADRPVVIIGHGDEAAAKVRLVSETRADIRIYASVPLEKALRKAARAASAQVVEALPGHEDLAAAALVFIATEDEALDRALADQARAAGVPVNVVDRPELCDFYTPALVNRAPLAVAINTAGTAPVLARHVRARIEALLPLRLGRLAGLADAFRDAARDMLPSGEIRRRFWARFFSGSVSDHMLAGDDRRAREEAQRLLNGAADTDGYVWLVGAGPGAEDLLTLRAQRLLQEADVIVHDSLVPNGVIAMGRRDAERIDVGKRKNCHSKSQGQINDILVAEARKGRRVVRLKAGDPLVFGRAGEEMQALRDAGIGYEVVPGITSAAAAAADMDLPLTLRGVASTLVFTTGHDMNGQTLPDWAKLAIGGATIAVYMGKTVAADVASRLMDGGLGADTPVMVIENASRIDRRALSGVVADLPGLEKRGDLDGPALIVIGEAVAYARLTDAEPLAQAASELAA